jgi:hypothetical protein
VTTLSASVHKWSVGRRGSGFVQVGLSLAIHLAARLLRRGLTLEESRQGGSLAAELFEWIYADRDRPFLEWRPNRFV